MERWDSSSSTRPSKRSKYESLVEQSQWETSRRSRSNAFIELLREDFRDPEAFSSKWQLGDSEAGVLCSCRWSPSCATISKKGLCLCLRRPRRPSLLDKILGPNTEIETSGTKSYLGAKVSCNTCFYRCGRYSTSIMPSSSAGVVTSFVLTSGTGSEITVDFLGNCPNSVQIGYSSPEHESYYKVEIEAPQDGWHQVQIEWKEDKISWNINQAEIHTVNTGIPKVGLRPQYSIWSVDGSYSPAAEWAGTLDSRELPTHSYIANLRVVV